MSIDCRKIAHQQMAYMVERRREFHQYPEPSMHEVETTKRIARELDAMGIPYRLTEPTGLIAEIKGGKPGRTVALRSDIDALCITEKTGLPFASRNPGFMHACGHDTHMAMLLGAAKGLLSVRDQIPGTVRLVFQPAEETGEGARLMVKQGALEGVGAIFGEHIGAMTPVGMVSYHRGAWMASCDSFSIDVEGVGGHGCQPEKTVDALVTACAIVMNLQSIVSRELPSTEPRVITVGKLESGSRFNVVASSAHMEGTCRTLSREIHAALPGMIERIATHTAESYRAKAKVSYDCLTDVLVCDPALTEEMVSSARKIVTSPSLIQEVPQSLGGEDFAEYTKYVPATFVSIGCGGDYPQHSDHHHVEEEAFETGCALHLQFALDWLAAHPL